MVVANILAEVILLFPDDVYQALQPGGYFIASGIYKNKEQVVREGLLAAGFEIEETAQKKTGLLSWLERGNFPWSF